MKWRARFCIVSAVVSAPLWAQAAGLSTTFVDVVIESVQIGKMVEARGPEGKSLVVRNLGDSPVVVSVQALAPTPAQLRPGAQILPDLSWVHFDPPSVMVPAQREKDVKVTVQVPHRKEFRDRTYQVMVWTRGETAHGQGIRLNAGLLSCLRIHTVP